ncbi:hypothetical protein V1264_013883 [Littorina saxatilis]|uniref:Uncharacterized protein n=1 Tax=Littorina saxatilis TaxID=31220 RepID=A0AAN9BQL1_9CAEN
MWLQPWSLLLLLLLILSLASPSGTDHQTLHNHEASTQRRGRGVVWKANQGEPAGPGAGEDAGEGQCPSQCHVWLDTVLACQQAGTIHMQKLARCALSLPALQVVDLNFPSPFCNCTLLDFADRAFDLDIITFTQPPCPTQLLVNCGPMLPDRGQEMEHRGLVAGLVMEQDDPSSRKATKRHLSWLWDKVKALQPKTVKTEYSSRLRQLIKDVSRRKREQAGNDHQHPKEKINLQIINMKSHSAGDGNESRQQEGKKGGDESIGEDKSRANKGSQKNNEENKGNHEGTKNEDSSHEDTKGKHTDGNRGKSKEENEGKSKGGENKEQKGVKTQGEDAKDDVVSERELKETDTSRGVTHKDVVKMVLVINQTQDTDGEAEGHGKEESKNAKDKDTDNEKEDSTKKDHKSKEETQKGDHKHKIDAGKKETTSNKEGPEKSKPHEGEDKQKADKGERASASPKGDESKAHESEDKGKAFAGKDRNELNENKNKTDQENDEGDNVEKAKIGIIIKANVEDKDGKRNSNETKKRDADDEGKNKKEHEQDLEVKTDKEQKAQTIIKVSSDEEDSSSKDHEKHHKDTSKSKLKTQNDEKGKKHKELDARIAVIPEEIYDYRPVISAASEDLGRGWNKLNLSEDGGKKHDRQDKAEDGLAKKKSSQLIGRKEEIKKFDIKVDMAEDDEEDEEDDDEGGNDEKDEDENDDDESNDSDGDDDDGGDDEKDEDENDDDESNDSDGDDDDGESNDSDGDDDDGESYDSDGDDDDGESTDSDRDDDDDAEDKEEGDDDGEDDGDEEDDDEGGGKKEVKVETNAGKNSKMNIKVSETSSDDCDDDEDCNKRKPDPIGPVKQSKTGGFEDNEIRNVLKKLQDVKQYAYSEYVVDEPEYEGDLASGEDTDADSSDPFVTENMMLPQVIKRSAPADVPETDIVITETDKGTEIDAVKHPHPDQGTEEPHQHAHLDDPGSGGKQVHVGEGETAEVHTKPEHGDDEVDITINAEYAPAYELEELLYVVGGLLTVLTLFFCWFIFFRNRGKESTKVIKEQEKTCWQICFGPPNDAGDESTKPLIGNDGNEDVESGPSDQHQKNKPSSATVKIEDKPPARPTLLSLPESPPPDTYENSDEHKNFLQRLTKQRLSIYQHPMEDEEEAATTNATAVTSASESEPASEPSSKKEKSKKGKKDKKDKAKTDETGTDKKDKGKKDKKDKDKDAGKEEKSSKKDKKKKKDKGDDSTAPASESEADASQKKKKKDKKEKGEKDEKGGKDKKEKGGKDKKEKGGKDKKEKGGKDKKEKGGKDKKEKKSKSDKSDTEGKKKKGSKGKNSNAGSPSATSGNETSESETETDRTESDLQSTATSEPVSDTEDSTSASETETAKSTEETSTSSSPSPPVPKRRTLSFKKAYSQWQPEEFEMARGEGAFKRAYSQWTADDFERARSMSVIEGTVPAQPEGSGEESGDEDGATGGQQETQKPVVQKKPATQKPAAAASPVAAPAPKEPSEKQLGRRRMTIMTQFGEVGADFGDDKAKENIPDNIKYGAA